jgi:arylsulfatase A-like enzyme
VHYLPFWDTWTEQAKTDKTAEQIVNAYLHRQREELYDLSADPYEMHNLADDPSQADLRRSLRQQLADWCRQQGDTDPLEYLKP